MATTAERKPKVIKKGGNVASIADHAKKKENGKAAAADPKDAYDGLTQPQQDLYDAIGAMGFRPEQVSRGWRAMEINFPADREPRCFGPFDSLVLVHNEVKAETEKHPVEGFEKSEDPEETLVDEKTDGRRLLPGQEIRVNKKLNDLIKRRCAAVKVFTEASAKVQEINAEVLAVYNDPNLRALFVENAEKKKAVYTNPAGGELRIKHNVTDTVESSLGDDDDE